MFLEIKNRVFMGFGLFKPRIPVFFNPATALMKKSCGQNGEFDWVSQGVVAL